MQQSPTLSGVRLRTVNDALKVFHAVAQGHLPMIVRRLDFEERKGIKSGNIYVWEERNASTSRTGLGIERWTDGHQYTPSRGESLGLDV
jgi:Gti1/Pac2 family transcription factor